MFDYDYVLRTLEDFEEMKEKKRIKFLRNLFYDETFIEWLFQPKPEPTLDEKMSALYHRLTRPRVIRTLIEMIEDTGYNKFNRSHATFLYSICNVAISSNNERVIEVENQRKNGELTNKEVQNINAKLEKYSQFTASLMKATNKIVKRDAKELSRECNLPKYICIAALHSVPEPKYVDRFKIGYYLNTLLSTVYSEVDALGGFNKEVRWKNFFKEIFGKENVVEAATFILLEGVHRIDKYKNSKDVKECWDSLSAFALRELNESPEQIRNQMIELYIKRIDKMFANRTFDLRVDLLSINESLFPKLAATIEKYTDRISSILTRGK